MPTPTCRVRKCDLGADGADAPEEIRGEVQSGGGRGDRAVVPRVHRLVPLAIVGLGRVVSGDVRGQGRQAVAVEQLEHGPRRLDRHLAHAVFLLRDDAHARRPGPHAHLRARAAPAARTDQRIPPLAVDRPQHQELHRMSAGLEGAEEPRGNHAALVGDDAIALPQEPRQIAEAPVHPRPPRAVHDEESRGVARLGGLLCDQLGRQFIVEQRDIHDPRSLARGPPRPEGPRCSQPIFDPGGASKSGRSRITCPASS